MATQGPDLTAPRGTAWSQQFNIQPGAVDPGPISGWPITANLMDNWQPIGNILATASIAFPSDPGPIFLRPFVASFTAAQLLLPNTAEVNQFLANNSGATAVVLPNFTYYFSVWRTDTKYCLFWSRFIITPSTYQ